MGPRPTSFGTDAERYDRARPDYPADLVDHLMVGDRSRVLDVGCGTGKVGRLFAARGCDVVGVEADPRMARVAERHGLEVEVVPFESWDPAGRSFDLAVAGQSWHWIDHRVGRDRLAEALKPGGVVAAFWNVASFHPAVTARFDEIFARHAPDADRPAGFDVRHGADDQMERHRLRFRGDSRFLDDRIAKFEWHRNLTTEEWIDELGTHSSHIALPDDRRRRLHEVLGQAADDLGGILSVSVATWSVEATRAING